VSDADELSDAQLLFDVLPTVLTAPLERGVPPEPDVIARIKNGELGVEFTRIVLEREMVRREGEQQRVMARARAEFDSSQSQRILVNASWSEEVQFTKVARPTLVARLLAEIESMLAEGRDQVARCVYPSIASPPRDSAFGYIELVRDAAYVESAFGLMLSWNHTARGIAFLQEQLSRKHSKPSNYRGEYSERWVVLVHAGETQSSSVVLKDAVWTHPFESPYDRAFVLFRKSRQVTQLQLKRLGAAA